ncbi:antitoxin [Paracidobacterium acidisoli]|uniref:AbrB/MazE/SpoVT family DNA-binding domain-containing protein n=1 Tax=Paracidobacterium acidisoli TaxID=2303751 RepID=A0A372IKU8_9BACT|nr:AbrB/MazE/SpoVT family DNA-binding domain-containing protein [Paracidobacterium acidisoli]MBT9332918.1 AbrB/MazE/SpoVT family DNA-binding domain-containing protein [Paracidobacterium acidisoli]
MTIRTAKLFRNGRSQAVRLPAEFRFEGTEEVEIRRDEITGDVILSQPLQKAETGKEFLEFVARLQAQAPEEFEGFMEDRPWHDPRRRDPFK